MNRVLYVDFLSTDCAFFRGISAKRFKIDCTHTMRGADQFLRENRYDLLVTDFGESITEVSVEIVRALYESCRIPVVILAENARWDLRLKLIRNQPCLVLDKEELTSYVGGVEAVADRAQKLFFSTRRKIKITQAQVRTLLSYFLDHKNRIQAMKGAG